MNQNKNEIYRQMLKKELGELKSTALAFEERGIHENMNDVTGELSAYDQHPADYGSQIFEREKDIGLLENIENQIKLVEKALDRLKDGLYGTCEKCDQTIDEERLKALPYATLCISCKQEDEQRLAPDATNQNLSFGRSFNRGDEIGFDGEDAWQAVARFGTSNSLQDDPTELENQED